MMGNLWSKNKYLIWLACLALVVCGLICCRIPEQSTPVEVDRQKLTDPNIVRTVCALIYRGKFGAAGDLIKHIRPTQSAATGRLAEIVSEYEALGQQRRLAQEAAYAEKLAELEKFRTEADFNDVNDISSVLSVLARVSEFANEQQRDALLSEPFVKRVFKVATAKAAEFESEGKWFDAYLSCYSWLRSIDKDNKAYSDYSEKLLDKANIVASFRDSSCETRDERYAGVSKEMFVRAVDALRYNYVDPVDYRQMAIKAIEHCRLLAEVMDSSSVVRDALADRQEGVVDAQYDAKISAWSAALGAVLDEVKQSPMMSKDKFIDIFEDILSLNMTTLGLPSEVVIAHFVESALAALDPYTIMVWPKQVQDFEKVMTNEFTGIGIEISKQKGLLTVMSLLPGTPAYNSGLDAGDVIEQVDGIETKDMTLSCAVKNITGPAGTEVTLTIRRTGEQNSFDITITRAKIIVPTIRGWQRTEAGRWLYMIDYENKIGYVRVTSFSERTGSDLDKVLRGLEAEGLRGLILDLRFNTGGVLNAAVDVTDKFLKEGLIVITRPKSWIASTYKSARRAGTHPDYPLVVLINQYSASASEIVAGALADKTHNRAILVGERTHGKGSVQGIANYPKYGAQLKYTMAYYHLPSGQRVESRDEMEKQGREDWGVGPDVEVELNSLELKTMSDIQRDNDVLFRAGHDEGGAPPQRHTAGETLAADPQLAVGLLVARTKLIESNLSTQSVN
jgi:carboxyl-terminal processing protease